MPNYRVLINDNAHLRWIEASAPIMVYLPTRMRAIAAVNLPSTTGLHTMEAGHDRPKILRISFIIAFGARTHLSCRLIRRS